MLLQIKRGCINHANLINGMNFFDLSIDKQREIIDILIKEYSSLEGVFEVLAERVINDEEYSGNCEQCGDYYYGYKLEIEQNEK